MENHDYDGYRVAEKGLPYVWLVFQGKRHHIASGTVYASLFGENFDILFDTGFDAIDFGPDLSEGSCLIRASQSRVIYLATGTGLGTRLMQVKNHESMLDFGFDEAMIKDVPQLLVDAMPKGRMLESALSRTKVNTISLTQVSFRRHHPAFDGSTGR